MKRRERERKEMELEDEERMRKMMQIVREVLGYGQKE